jgi:undecaprenyl pyrophosphate phosphatase UppP
MLLLCISSINWAISQKPLTLLPVGCILVSFKGKHMGKVILLSMLLVLVYQFDELVRGVLHLIRRLLRHKHRDVIRDSDHYVGTALTIATMPLLLYTLLLSDIPLAGKLLWLAIVYLAFAAVSAGVGYFARQSHRLRHQHGYTLAFSAMGLVGGLFHPALNMVPWHAGRERLTYAKLAFLLSIPALLGAAFKSYYDSINYYDEWGQYMEVLIIVMVGGLFINIIIHVLERYFKAHDPGILGYFRIVAGLAIAFFLLL